MSRYVQITREEIEEWLDSLGMKWELKEDTQGVYFIHLPQSKKVSVRFTSSVGRTNTVVSKGKASMEVVLISRIKDERGFYPILNRKDVGQKFYRTLNWRKTLQKAIQGISQVYLKSRDFYEKIAEKDRYVKNMMAVIQRIPSWDAREDLKRYVEILEEGKILSSAQESQLADIVKQGVTKTNLDPEVSATSKEDLLQKMRDLYRKAKIHEDAWILQFTESVAKQYKIRGTLSDKQKAVLDNAFLKYNIS